MKKYTKINKLTLLITLLFFTTTTICITDFKDNKNIKDIRTELKSLSPNDEKAAAKKILIKNDGIVYKNEFIPKTNSFKVLTVRLTVYWAKIGRAHV